MSNIVRKGDFLVFENLHGQVTEFFIASNNINLDVLSTSTSGRKNVYGCFGFKLSNCHYYEPGTYYWINRKATLSERDQFLQWMKDRGYKFNHNTLVLTLNR